MGLSNGSKKGRSRVAIIHVEEQIASPPDFFSGVGRQKRNFIFREFEYGPIVQAEVDNDFEWWFPKANGSGFDAKIHNASLCLSANVKSVELFIQNDDMKRVHVALFDGKLAHQHVPNTFIVPCGTRGVLYVEQPTLGMMLKATYLVERY